MAPKKKKTPKPPRLPPTTLQGVITYYRNRGYQQDPLLEDRKDADVTFRKPLPNGSRIHVRVKEGSKWLHVEQHIDSADPERDPIGHFVDDVVLGEIKHDKYKIRKRKTRSRRTTKPKRAQSRSKKR